MTDETFSQLNINPDHRVFVDTNVLVYAFDQSEPAKAVDANRLLKTLGPRRTVISGQILNEFYVTVTRKLKPPLNETQAEEALNGLSRLEVVPVDVALVRAGVRRSRSSRLSLWDALVVEAARRAKCEVLLTEDLNSGATLGGVRVVNPFAEA